MAELDEIVGIEQVGVSHVNDSKRSWAAAWTDTIISVRELGLTAFEYLVNDPRFQDVPMVIETSGGAEKHPENLKTLRWLVKKVRQAVEGRCLFFLSFDGLFKATPCVFVFAVKQNR